MRYKLFYWKWYLHKRFICIFDMQEACLMEFLIDEFEVLDVELQEYLKSIRDKLTDSNYEYKL